MRVSKRSCVLLAGSAATPVTILAFRIASLDHRRAIAAVAKYDVGDIASLLPDFVFFGGILCFIGFLISIVFDYLRSGRTTWPSP